MRLTVNKGIVAFSGPYLFNIFLSDIYIPLGNHDTLFKYADDSTIIAAVWKEGDFSDRLVSQFLDWTKTNGIPCNPRKCKEKTIARILQPYNLSVVSKPITTLRRLLTNVRDKDKSEDRQGAVYKIKCCDCLATYIGETGRNFSTRLTEHKQATRNGDINFIDAIKTVQTRNGDENFIDAIKTIQIPDDHKLVSFDVKSLFTGIPLQLALDCTENAIENSTVELPLPIDDIMDLK